MMRIQIKQIPVVLILLLTCFSASARAPDFNLTWNKQGPMQAELYMAIDSVYDAYKDVSTLQLGVDDKYEFLNNAFAEDIAEVQAEPNNHKWVTAATDNGEIIGYASFEYDANKREIYVRQFAIGKTYKRQGIGTKILQAGIKQYPDAKKLVTITRKVNSNAIKFYKKFGFKAADYMHEGYDPNKYVGYEMQL